jgi:hypothetical protein
MLKEAILPDAEAVILLDFSENYLFLCQDAIQGFQWETDHATLHPFVVYYRSSGPQNSMKEECVRFCEISDCLEHTAITVHCFISCIVHHLVPEVLPHLRKVYYFSNVASSQYKNCKNFLNLCYHEKDFHLAAEWNFFPWDWWNSKATCRTC